ncbi:hypothetical protein R0J90_20715, partial [Micrococcus sp. SIMBA_144]
KLTGQRVTLRKIEERDLPTLWDYIYGNPSPEWKKWDAPYFEHKYVPLEEYMESSIRNRNRTDEFQRIIEVDGTIIGTVAYY